MAASTDQTLHGTVIAAAGRGALIRGPSGAGKSDLALRCLALAPSALLPHAVELVTDDRVEIRAPADASAGWPTARPPATIRGLLEVRGLGILTLPYRAEVELRLVVDLVAPDAVERLPPDPLPTTPIAGVPLPVLQLAAHEASAPLKLLLALTRA